MTDLDIETQFSALEADLMEARARMDSIEVQRRSITRLLDGMELQLTKLNTNLRAVMQCGTAEEVEVRSTAFALEISAHTTEEVRWLKKHIAMIEGWARDEATEKDLSHLAELSAGTAWSLLAPEIRRGKPLRELRFEWVLRSPTKLRMYALEDADVIVAAMLIQAFLQAHKRKDLIELEWASWSNKPTSGAFGGGFYLISAGSARELSISDWIRRTTQELAPPE